MSDLALQLPLEQAKEGVRLARLFRHTGESTEGRYLMDILTCYRGAEPS